MTDYHYGFLAGAAVGYVLAMLTFILMLGLCYAAKEEK